MYEFIRDGYKFENKYGIYERIQSAALTTLDLSGECSWNTNRSRN
jgi:hypothetical protein